MKVPAQNSTASWFWIFTGLLAVLFTIVALYTLMLSLRFESGAGDPLQTTPPYGAVRVFGLHSCPRTQAMITALLQDGIPYSYHVADNFNVIAYLDQRYPAQKKDLIPFIEVRGEFLENPAPQSVIQKFRAAAK